MATLIQDIRARFGAMTGILKIACAATFLLGVFQLVAIVLPAVSPNIDGVVLTNPVLQLVAGFGHALLGWGIFGRKSWARPLLVVFPVFQYGVLYIAIQLPPAEIPPLHLVWTAGWAMFFAFYCYRGGGRGQFEREAEAA